MSPHATAGLGVTIFRQSLKELLVCLNEEETASVPVGL